MPRFVALLRGVNVGASKAFRVPMADFKALLHDAGYTDVQTILNSGNAVFVAKGRSVNQLARAIADGLQARLGVTTPVIVKSAAQVQAIVQGSPIKLPDDPKEHSRCLVALSMDAQALQELQVLKSLPRNGEAFELTAEAAYLHCRSGLMDSALAKALLGKAGRGVTTRNWGTMLKIWGLLDGAST